MESGHRALYKPGLNSGIQQSTMVFNSLAFLLFIAIFLPLYFNLKGQWRLWLCLVGSYFFYGWWDWRFLGLIVLSTLIDYSVGLWLDQTEDQAKRRQLLTVSVIANLGVLGFFKYFNFFAESLEVFLQQIGVTADYNTLHIILPVGISFYTFQSMSYTIDVYHKKLKSEPDFIRFATFISFFPQLVAGPIVRARDFLPQFRTDRTFDWDRFFSGSGQVLWGFFKKVAVADSLAPFVDQCFASPGSFSSLHLIIGVVFYSFQIYCDFSGYSDIAIGLGRIMGFDFPVNFRTPYFSKNFSEFWTRWHISLSSWLRDYLYIPLGGNRQGKWQTFRNLMITMLLGGLWHGASWVFVFWGFLHGLYLVIQRLAGTLSDRLHQKLGTFSWLRDIGNIALVYGLTCFAWIFFRSPEFSTAAKMIGGIGALDNLSFGAVTNKFIVLKGMVLMLFLVSVELANFRFKFDHLVVSSQAFRIASFALLLWLIAFFGTFDANAFIYFQF